MDDLALKLAEQISEADESIAVSAVVVGDSIGYPARILDEDEESRDGEHNGFDEAYDFACELFEADECEVERDGDMFWFTKS